MTTATEQIIDQWAYQSEDGLIVPYVPNIPSDSFPEELLCILYAKTKKDGLLRRTFPGCSNFNLNWFVNYFYSRPLLIAIRKPAEIVGFGWVYETDGNERFKKGSVGFAFFKDAWGDPLIQEIARLGLRWWFEEAGLNLIYATIASWNRSSVRFAKLMGFELIGRAPGFFFQGGIPINVDLLCLKREEFFAKGKV